jgi:hypothetical protein
MSSDRANDMADKLICEVDAGDFDGLVTLVREGPEAFAREVVEMAFRESKLLGQLRSTYLRDKMVEQASSTLERFADDDEERAVESDFSDRAEHRAVMAEAMA